MNDDNPYSDEHNRYCQDDNVEVGSERKELPHSGFGVASFVISLVVGALEFVLVGVAGYLESSKPGGLDEESPEAVLLGLGIIGGAIVAVLGIMIGIAGLVQDRRRKVFAGLGVACNILIIIGIAVLIVIGIAMETAPGAEG
jgi:hypothetical protein